LQDVGEQGAARGSLAEEGENQRCHAEVGECTEDGVVALQNPEGSESDNSEIIGDKILYDNRNTLDEDVDQRYENAYLDVSKCLQCAIR